MLKEEKTEGYKIIHLIPDMPEEEKEAVKQNITKKIYNLFSNKKVRD